MTLKILLVPSPPYEEIGGVSTHVYMLARGLRDLGHDVHVTESRPSRPYRAPFVTFPALALGTFSRYLSYRWALAANHLYYLIEGLSASRFRPDVVNIQNVQHMTMARRMRALTGCGVVLTMHGYLTTEAEQSGQCVRGDDFWHWLRTREVRGYLDADRIVAVSSNIATYIREGFEHAPIRVVHNGIDTGIFRPQKEQSDKTRPSGLRLLFAGWLEPQKGLVDAIEALATMRHAGVDANLAVAGDGYERERARSLAAELSVESAVDWRGTLPKSAMPSFYTSGDVLLMPSRTRGSAREGESFAYTALEAMACCIPVVAYNTGGLPELIKNGRTGVLVPEGDKQALADAALLFVDEALKRRMGLDARRLVEDNFSVPVMARRFIKVYMEAARPAKSGC